MYTHDQLLAQLAEMGIDPKGTLLVHSSMKAIGQVEGGPDGVIDALMDYMKDGLLVFPTHTWKQIKEKEYPVFDVVNEPSCVGLLTNVFRVRPGVVRSFHPTHSVAAFGRDAAEYVSGEEKRITPCGKGGCWYKLYERKAQILFLGCGTNRNTFLHGVEEWNGVSNRLSERLHLLYTLAPNGKTYPIPQYRHYTRPPVTEVSQRYNKMEDTFVKKGAMRYGAFGDAHCALGDAQMMCDITSACLKIDPHLFDDDRAVPEV